MDLTLTPNPEVAANAFHIQKNRDFDVRRAPKRGSAFPTTWSLTHSLQLTAASTALCSLCCNHLRTCSVTHTLADLITLYLFTFIYYLVEFYACKNVIQVCQVVMCAMCRRYVLYSLYDSQVSLEIYYTCTMMSMEMSSLTFSPLYHFSHRFTHINFYCYSICYGT